MKTFFLNKNIIKTATNEIIITKDYNFIAPKFYLDINNKKNEIKNIEKISETVYKISFLLNNKSHPKLIILDGIIEEIFPLFIVNDDINDNNIFIQNDFKLEASYQKDKININIQNKKISKKDIILNFEGDLNKTIFWKNTENDLNIHFPFQIKGFKILNFKLNNIDYKIKIYNTEDFPRNLIKVKNGIKLNKVCEWDLKLVYNNTEKIIKKGESLILLDLNQNQLFKVYIDDYFIFEQMISIEKFLPKINIIDNPLRLKLSQPFWEDITLKFKNKDKVWIIPQGKTEVNLYFEKGIHYLEIEEIKNAIPTIENHIYHIK